MNTVLNWSSGKDAALALHLLRQSPEYTVTRLLTTVNTEKDRVVMHGVRKSLLQQQAASIGLPLLEVGLPAAPTNEAYQEAMAHAVATLKQEGVAAAAFGDIFLEDLRAYREEQLAAEGLRAVFPLWKKDTARLVAEVEDTGIEAIIVCVNAKVLGPEFLGRKIDRSLLEDLPAGVDPCGEHGEYHSFVYNAPFFREPVSFSLGETVYKTYPDTGDAEYGFYFQDVFQ